MHKWFNTKDRIFWISALLLTAFIAGPATASSGTFTVTGYASSPTFSGPGNPPPLQVGDSISVQLSASANCSGTNPSGQECTIDTKTFSYPKCQMYYSEDDVQPYVPVGGASIINVDSTNGNATLAATFQNSGYYEIYYTVEVDYTSSTCGNGSATQDYGESYSVDAGDFSLNTLDAGYNMASDPSITIFRGNAGSQNIQINSIKGFNFPVSFSAQGNTGFTASGGGTPPANGFIISSATITVNSSTAIGSYPLTIRGTANVANPPIFHDVPVTVDVAQAYITGPYDASNYNLNGVVTPNPKNADLSVISDAALTYDASQAGNDPWRQISSLVANPSGPYVYNWSAGYGTFDNTGNSNTQTNYSVFMDDNGSNSNSAFPSTTANLSINDPTGAKLSSNAYTIRWHHTSENWAVDKTKPVAPTFKFLTPDASDISGFPTQGMDFSPTAYWKRIDFDFAGMIAAGEIASIAGAVSVKDPIKEGLYQYIGLQFAKLGDAIKDVTQFGGPIALRPVFEGGATDPSYGDTFEVDPVEQYGYKDSLPSATKIAIENHYTADAPRYYVPYGLTPYIGDKYDDTGYAGHITTNLYIYYSGANPDSHVVCKFSLKKQA